MSDYQSNRLFAVHGRTEAESSSARRTNRAAQSALFDWTPRDPAACPACGGLDCTCSRTGAEALTLCDQDRAGCQCGSCQYDRGLI